MKCSALIVGFTLVFSASVLTAAEPLSFEKKRLQLSNNEGCAIGDVDKDGKLDIVAGTHWFRNPDFKPRDVREILPFGKDYIASNGDHLLDMNGDGWLDVVAAGFVEKEMFWYENPQKAGLEGSKKFAVHKLGDLPGRNEATFFHDLNGDGKDEIIMNTWNKNAPLLAWSIEKDSSGKPIMKEHVLNSKGNSHGVAFGDINGDGREDILGPMGWWECPESDPLNKEWKLHNDWTFKHLPAPFLVVDLNGDGKNDYIHGEPHGYGLFWNEQLDPAEDGKLQFKQHLIDKSFSQPHCLHWADIDNDKEPELITGKRVRAHSGRDPGGSEPACLYYYDWDSKAKKFTRHTISEGEEIGIGLQIRTADINADGKLDIAVAGKSGTWVLLSK